MLRKYIKLKYYLFIAWIIWTCDTNFVTR